MAALSGGLNAGRLPSGFYAMTGYTTPDGEPPLVDLDVSDDLTLYAARRRRVTIFRESDDHPVARVKMVTPGDRRSPATIDRFVTDLVASAEVGLALLVIDPFPADAHASGLQDWVGGGSSGRPGGQHITFAVHGVGERAAWSFRHARIGEPRPDVMLPLAPGVSAAMPLGASYARAFEGMPRHLIAKLERSP